jgi:hypothetical protein
LPHTQPILLPLTPASAEAQKTQSSGSQLSPERAAFCISTTIENCICKRMRQMLKTGTLVAAILATASLANAQSTLCIVDRKVDTERVYSDETLAQSACKVRVFQIGDQVAIQRCSFSPSQGRETCDTYEVDHIETDGFVGITKNHHYRGQFDVQIFPSGTMVENSGRGSIAFGKCSPE